MFGKNKLGWLIAIIVVIVSLVFTFYQPSEKDLLKVIFFDVGQGDSIFIKTPNNSRVLIDGGPDNTVIYKLGQYLPWWQRKIDLVILTHPHADHVVGLIEVLKRFQVKKILMTGILYSSPEYFELKDIIERQDIEIEFAQKDEDFLLDPALTFKILYPIHNLSGQEVKNLNNSSIVIKLIYQNISFLFTGDLEADIQEEILSDNLSSTVLKVPHQGSSDSLNIQFLELVNPQVAVISVGENKFGHPSLRFINNLERLDSRIYITQKDSDIKIVSKGKQIQINNKILNIDKF